MVSRVKRGPGVKCEAHKGSAGSQGRAAGPSCFN